MPFKAQFEGKSDIKNYADYLVEKAGPAILQWIIEGAERVIAKNYHLDTPDCVASAINEYRGRMTGFGISWMTAVKKMPLSARSPGNFIRPIGCTASR